MLWLDRVKGIALKSWPLGSRFKLHYYTPTEFLFRYHLSVLAPELIFTFSGSFSVFIYHLKEMMSSLSFLVSVLALQRKQGYLSL